jgi:hypothetical protein
VEPTVTSTPPKRITWAPSVTGGIAPIATYQTATINPGQRRHRATTAQKASADRAAFLSASITIHPGIKGHTWTKRRSASRRSHRRRVQQPLPATHINHLQSRAPHITITSHVASFAAQISAITNTFQSAHTVIDANTGESYEHAQLIRGPNAGEWLYSTANEFGHLTKGVAPHMPSGSETMRYIFHHQLPPGRHATYARFVATERPHKAETKRVQLTVGGNLVHYPDKVSTPAADLSTVKLLLNSVISTPGARFATFDLKDFYLGTPMMRKEYMRIPLTSIPQTMIDQYELLAKAHKGFVLVEISKGMYGLPQAGILAFNQLKSHLTTHGYAPCTHTPGLWTHSTRPIAFTLIVDDFGIKYTNRDDAIRLLSALEELYTVTTDWTGWTGSLYLAMTLTWDYIRATVDVSMPRNVTKALERFQHTPPHRHKHSPHAWTKPVYGTHPQLTSPVDDTALLPPNELTRIQEITGTLLCYARAIDSTMLVATSHRSIPNATVKLCSRPSRRHCPLNRQRHVPPHPQRRLLPLRSKSPKSRRWYFLPQLPTSRPISNTRPQRHTSTTQRRHSHYQLHYAERLGICHRGRTRRCIPQRSRLHPTPYCTPRNGTSASSNTNPNRQCLCRWHCQRNSQAKPIQSN